MLLYQLVRASRTPFFLQVGRALGQLLLTRHPRQRAVKNIIVELLKYICSYSEKYLPVIFTAVIVLTFCQMIYVGDRL